MGRKVWVAALAIVACVVADGTDDKVRAQWETKRKDVAKKTATARVEVAEFCFGKKLHEVALLEYQLAFKLDPDNAKVRERLGYKKVSGAWEEKPSGAPKTKNECDPNEVNNLTSAYLDKKKRPFAKAADDWFNLGKWARDQKLAEEAQTAFREVLGFDPDHAKAREALGYKREGEKWVSPQDQEAAEAMKKKVAGSDEGEEVKDETPEEKAMGVPMSKRVSAHFLIETTLGAENARTYTKLAETLWEDFHTFMEMPPEKPLVQERITGVLLSTQAEHEKFIDGCFEGNDSSKAWYKKGGGQWTPSPLRFEGWKSSSEEEILDIVVHMTVHILFNAWLGAGGNSVPPWLYESMAYLFTVRLRQTALTYCITSSTGGGGKEGMPHDAGRWKEATRASVQRGEDPPVGRMLSAVINSIQGNLLLKGWSMLDWMQATHKAELLKFLETLGQMGGEEKAQREAWKAAFGQTPEETEAAWRVWVQANY